MRPLRDTWTLIRNLPDELVRRLDDFAWRVHLHYHPEGIQHSHRHPRPTRKHQRGSATDHEAESRPLGEKR